MLADLLSKDIRQYAARGVNFTPADIVRLNALAVAVKLCQHPCQGASLPRCVFLPPTSFWSGELVLREPTIAHELWLEEAAQWIDVRDERNFLFLHAFALSHFNVDALPDAFAPKKVIKGVFRFAAKRLSRYTMNQLRNAVDYALFGADWTAGEAAVKSGGVKSGGVKSGGVDSPTPSLTHSPTHPLTHSPTHPLTNSPTLGVLTTARAMRLPISLDDAMRMTASELGEAMVEAMVRDETFDAKSARHSAMGDYIRTRDAIIARIQAEKEAKK